ncbi:MAG: gliding motility-associated C-terminal domain-containing protein [Bacteroidetes bacterium]|nr:gliding motility-associated C-terminal domain-containing protein [Bacteroidota bacterium]
MIVKRFFYLFLCYVCASQLTGQTDTTFWFSAPNISQGLGDRPIYLYFNTYSQGATVSINQPANSSFVTITKVIPANAIDSVNLTPWIDSIENSISNKVLRHGLHISSTANISAMYALRAGANREYFTLKGTKGIGTNFYIPMQSFWDQSPVTSPKSFSSIEIVASQNNTTVLITPKTNIIGHSAGITYSVSLQRGQTYSCQDTAYTASTSLGGSIISSDKPVAVTMHSSGLSQGGCLSSVGDQITTTDYIGTDYIINRGAGILEKIFVLSTQNNTSITVNDGVSNLSQVINWGETYTYTPTQAITYIKTNKPVYVLHVSSYGCRLSGAQVPAFFCSGTYTTAFTRASSDSFAVNISTRTGFEGSFLLNGSSSLVPASAFTVVPGSSGSMKSARIYYNTTTIPVGSHNVLVNTGDIFGLGIHNGSNTTGSAYGYVSEFAAYPTINAGVDYTVCANGTVLLNGQVGGGNVQGTWSTNGFGSFAAAASALTNTYVPNQVDTTLKPVRIILSSNGPCPQLKDTINITVGPSPLVNASIDQIVCANNSVVQLNGNVSGGATTGIWTSSGSGAFSPDNLTFNATYTPSAADTAAGLVKLVLSSTNNGSCAVERDTMLITINKAPFADAGPASYSVCANNPTLTVNGTIYGSTNTGKWSSSGTGAFSPSNIQLSTGYLPSNSDIAAGTVKLYLTSTNNGSCFPAKDSIRIVFTQSPQVDAGVDLYSCKNNASTLLNGLVTGPTTTGIWSGGAGTFAPSNTVFNATYTPSAAELSNGFADLTLTSTNNANCIATNDQVRINFVPKPLANFNFNNACLHNTTSFTDFSLPAIGTLDQWQWTFGDGAVSTQQNPAHTYSATASYPVKLVVRNTYGCYDTTIKTPVIYPLPNNGFGVNRICTGAFLNLSFSDSSTIAAPENIQTWFWDFGGAGQSNLQNPIQYFPGSGLYNITLITTSNHGCKDTLVKQITLNPRPIAGFAYSLSGGVNVGTTVNFVDTSKYSTGWSWNFGDGSPASTLENPNTIYYANGVFVVVQVVSDSYGCTDTAKVAIKINNVTTEISTLIPNAISPNGDGKNDVWKLDFIELLYPNAEIEIYNRWGEQMFQSTGYKEAWDGTYKGEKLPVATYYYVIKLNDAANTEPFKGGVLLIR